MAELKMDEFVKNVGQKVAEDIKQKYIERAVLDKIRDEIERKANSGQWSEATIYGMQKSIAIIDKYKV